MRQTLIIARREYLSYVATWGFWISILIFPVLVGVGALIGVINSRTEPGRLVAVVTDDTASRLAIEAAVNAGDTNALSSAMERYLRDQASQEDVETAKRALVRARSRGDDGNAAAFDAIGADASLREGFVSPTPDLILVDPPAETPEALRPYLLGEQLVDGPRGRAKLHAAAFITRDDEDRPAVDYWSSAITEGAARNTIENALRELIRQEELAKAGIDPQRVAEINRLRPAVRELTPEREAGEAEVQLSDRAPYFIGLGLGYLLWVVIFSVANMLLTSSIEERSSKVFDSLLASTTVRSILLGKLLGVALVGITFLASWMTFVVGGLAVGASVLPPQIQEFMGQVLASFADFRLIIPFIAYFVAGYAMYGALYLSIGSLCDTIQEAQTLMTPMMIILMLPILVIAMSFSNPTSPLLNIAAWVPLFTPFIMLGRLPADPPLYQIIGTTVLMILTVCLILWASAKVFRHGLVAGGGIGSLRSTLAGAFGGGRRKNA